MTSVATYTCQLSETCRYGLFRNICMEVRHCNSNGVDGTFTPRINAALTTSMRLLP